MGCDRGEEPTEYAGCFEDLSRYHGARWLPLLAPPKFDMYPDTSLAPVSEYAASAPRDRAAEGGTGAGGMGCDRGEEPTEYAGCFEDLSRYHGARWLPLLAPPKFDMYPDTSLAPVSEYAASAPRDRAAEGGTGAGGMGSGRGEEPTEYAGCFDDLSRYHGARWLPLLAPPKFDM